MQAPHSDNFGRENAASGSMEEISGRRRTVSDCRPFLFGRHLDGRERSTSNPPLMDGDPMVKHASSRAVPIPVEEREGHTNWASYSSWGSTSFLGGNSSFSDRLMQQSGERPTLKGSFTERSIMGLEDTGRDRSKSWAGEETGRDRTKSWASHSSLGSTGFAASSFTDRDRGLPTGEDQDWSGNYYEPPPGAPLVRTSMGRPPKWQPPPPHGLQRDPYGQKEDVTPPPPPPHNYGYSEDYNVAPEWRPDPQYSSMQHLHHERQYPSHGEAYPPQMYYQEPFLPHPPSFQYQKDEYLYPVQEPPGRWFEATDAAPKPVSNPPRHSKPLPAKNPAKSAKKKEDDPFSFASYLEKRSVSICGDDTSSREMMMHYLREYLADATPQHPKRCIRNATRQLKMLERRSQQEAEGIVHPS